MNKVAKYGLILLPRSILAQLTVLMTFSGSAVVAQPDVLSDRILFEPHPIPTAEEQAIPLVSFNALTEATASRASSSDGLPLTLEKRRELEAAIAAYVAAIGDEESEEGPYSNTLNEDLFAAAQAAQALQDHDQALDFLVRAQNVIRINDGLETLAQIPLMEAMVTSHLALDQVSQADEVQKAILDLRTINHGQGSVELVPAMLTYGDWNLNAFLDRSNILLNVERMNVAQFMNDPMNFIDDPRRLTDTPVFNLFTAQQAFLDAISILVENEEYFHPDILELENKLLKSYFLSIHRENILYEPDFYLTRKKSKTGSRLNTNAIELMESEEYRQGNASHQRRVSFISHNPERTSQQLASAMLEAADWHLLFERKVKAAREYQKVYEFFSGYPEMEAAARNQLYPKYPVILPIYLPAPNSREKLDMEEDTEAAYFGYFDVSFRIDKYGKAKKIRILDKGGEVTRNMEIRLNQYLQNILFRPRFRDAKTDTSELSLRYYLAI